MKGEKYIKADGELEYAGFFIPKLLEILERGGSASTSTRKDIYHKMFTLSVKHREVDFVCCVYETKTMIGMWWFKKEEMK